MADETTSLVRPERSPRWRLAAMGAGLGLLALALVVVGQPVPAALPTSLYGGEGKTFYGESGKVTLNGLDHDQQVTLVYDILVTQGFSATITCDKEVQPTYALCGASTCSPYGDASNSVAACACKEYDDASEFFLGGSNVHLAESAAYRNTVVSTYNDECGSDCYNSFCKALGDGTICDESGIGCDTISFHTFGYYRNRKLGDAYQARSSSGGDGAYVDPTCMGAPCWYSATDSCQTTCLCVMGKETSASLSSMKLKTAEDGDHFVQTDHCLTHYDDYTVVTSFESMMGLIGDMKAGGAAAAAGSAPAVVGSCASCTVDEK